MTALGTIIPVFGRAYVVVDSIAQVLATGVPDERDRRRTCGMPSWRADEYLAARILLRRLLAEVAAGAGGGQVLARRSGKPYLPASPHLEISLSHTRDLVAAAAGTGGAVGVDIEVPARVGRDLLRRCCTAAALDALDRLPPARRDVEFTWIWTAQEACVKAAGTGLSGRPWRIPVDPGQRSGRWNSYTWVALRDHFAVPVSLARTTLPEDDRDVTDHAAADH